MKIDAFDFDLPAQLIANHPITPREDAKLLHIAGTGLIDRTIHDLPALVEPEDVIIVNDTKVIPAFLQGIRTNAKISANLITRIGVGCWRALVKPAKRLKIGDDIVFGDALNAKVIDKSDDGFVVLDFQCQDEELLNQLDRIGHTPLPPYIKRAANARDKHDYQTIFASNPGAVAAPTAGLHFTPDLTRAIKAKGCQIHPITLHVGAGTFLPIRVDDSDDHVMHAEFGIVSQSVVDAILRAKANGGKVIAIGTTSLRILETAAQATGQIAPFHGMSDIFITPGYRFLVVDKLLSNFHLPRSTLFMLVCAFARTDQMHRAYTHAIDQDYRFYSYGDACFLECRNV